MMEPLISIIVPVYNCEKYIHKCVKSILTQSYKNIELILVNDGSTDNSLVVCYEYMKSDDRVKVIDKENGGPASARNTGIRESQGEYLAFVDSDDYLDGQYIEYLYSIIKKNGADIASCGFADESEHTHMQYPIQKFETEVFNFISDYDIKKHIPFVCWHILFDSTIIKENNINFNEDIFFMEDYVFNVRCFLKSNRIVVTSNILYYRIVRDDSLTNDTFSMPYFEKWYTQMKALNILKTLVETHDNMKYDFLYKESLSAAKMLDYIDKHNIVDKGKINELKSILKRNFTINNIKRFKRKKLLQFIILSLFPQTYCRLREKRNAKIKNNTPWYI